MQAMGEAAMREKDYLTFAQWISWIGATLAAAMAASAFAFTHFESKEAAKEWRAETSARLARIEAKLDQLKR